MPSLSFGLILTELNKLTSYELKQLYTVIEDKAVSLATIASISDEVKESKFTKGVVCPHCGSVHAVRNGKVKGKQRYLCRGCNKSFGDFTNSIVSGTKSSYDKWLLYIKCMVKGYSLRKTAIEVGITVTTAFYWRHKILTALHPIIEGGLLNGIVEADETFFLESFKGNHTKSTVFSMPRPPRKRGGSSKYRGISSEQICVTCAIDRSGNISAQAACKGRVTVKTLETIYRSVLDKAATLCTDKHRSYIQFAKNMGVHLVQIEHGKTKQDIYHIQHINAYHSILKNWIRHFKGISTKRLGNYLNWFKWLKLNKDKRDYEKVKALLIETISTQMNIKNYDFWNQKMLFI